MKVVKNLVLLQYGRAGEDISTTSEFPRTIHQLDAEKFIALDSESGGYPYSVDDIGNAHDFKTVEAAEKYRGHFKGMHVRKVTVTYEVE